jgi:hypothetical protein
MSNCTSKNIQKRGSRRGIKRYFCKDYKTSFSSNRRPKQLQKLIFEEYFLHRQTLKQLSIKYNRSIPWIMKQRDEYMVDYKVHKPKPVNLICDATFYGKRKDKFGTLVFKDNESKEILVWKHIESELVKNYEYLKNKLEAGKDFKRIVSRLTHTTEKNFIKNLDEWYKKYKYF